MLQFLKREPQYWNVCMGVSPRRLTLLYYDKPLFFNALRTQELQAKQNFIRDF